ncbi:hypothetical protein COLO4_24669 [Corchorus olitorius]|uniref:Zinc finger, CCHC-type n=1 Tax=Corchorus olitorius TaxID=93759 RepID=A0A1R3I8A2_9ROSI|nr:hypothetical protein COLO4_24669 [Corchorus olitorius]
MKQIADEIWLTGNPVDDDDLVLHVLKGVGSEFREIVAAIRVRETPLSFEQLNDLLTAHELYLKQQETPPMDVSIPTVNFNRRVSTNPASRGYRNRDFSRFPDNKSSSPAARHVCQICDRIGHLAKSCRKGKQFFSSSPRVNFATSSAVGNSYPTSTTTSIINAAGTAIASAKCLCTATNLPVASTDVTSSLPAAPHSAQSNTATDCGNSSMVGSTENIVLTSSKAGTTKG